MPARISPPSVGAVVSVAALAGYLAWYLTRPGRSLHTAYQEVQRLMGSITLTAEQQHMVAVIATEAHSMAMDWLVPAAVANAYAESRLDPGAVGDGGLSVGLFQLHARGGGAGMSVSERVVPELNARRIFEIVAGPQGAAVRAARGEATHAELARLFAHHIERCAECGHQGGDAQLDYRADLVARLYGAATAAAVP